MNISSSKLPIHLSDIQHLIYDNALLFKWNIETLPLSAGQVIVRSLDVINAVDEILEHLSVVENNENENQKTLLALLKCLGECKNRQQNNDHKLQTIEQNILDIHHRITAMLSNINTTRERFLQERKFQSHYSAQTTFTDKIEMGNELNIILEEERRGACTMQESESTQDQPHECSSVELQHPRSTKNVMTQTQVSMVCDSDSRTIRSGLDDQINFALIGKTGNGKSALGNSIIDHNAFVSEPSSTSVTKEVSDEVNEVNGRIMKVVDTPGVGDTDWEKDEAKDTVVNALTQAIAINSEGYHAFLMVVKFGGRFTKEDQGTVDFLKKVFGQTFVRKFCILVMTYGDQFEAQVKVSFQEWIKSQKGVLSDLVKECNNRVILFDNQTTDRHKKQKQINELIHIVDSLKQKNSRYNNDQFELARAEREALELTSEARLISDKAMTEANLILKQFQKLQETVKSYHDPSQLEPLLERINTLHNSIILKDNKTGALGDLLKYLETLKSTITKEIEVCSRIAEVEIQMRTKHDSQLKTLNAQLQDEKLNFDRLSQELKNSELHKIQKLEEEIEILKKQKEDLEMNQLDNALQFKLISNTIPEIDEQYAKVKEKHRKNVLSSMFHKIAKTFSKKTKDIDLPPEQDDLEPDLKQFMY